VPELLEIRSRIRDYYVTFGELQASLERDLSRPAAVVIDERVAGLYADSLGPFRNDVPVLRVPAIESNKTVDFAQKVILWLLEHDFKRTHLLVAIGGGIVQDLCCFAASILFRGVDWSFHPTTLLAQCDSCIGSKSSINVGTFKNQVGTFFPPTRINVDVTFTRSLDHKDLLSGLGEAIKVHFLDSEQRFGQIFDLYDAAVTNPEVLERVIVESLRIKKRVIEADEFDRDYRNIMNYGHTFGHALESVTRYSIPHGIAVTVGMGVANYLSERLGYLDRSTRDRMEQLLLKNVGRNHVVVADLDAYWEALGRDKKNVDRDVTCILTRGFGQMFRTKISLSHEIRAIIREGLEGMGATVSEGNPLPLA